MIAALDQFTKYMKHLSAIHLGNHIFCIWIYFINL